MGVGAIIRSNKFTPVTSFFVCPHSRIAPISVPGPQTGMEKRVSAGRFSVFLVFWRVECWAANWRRVVWRVYSYKERGKETATKPDWGGLEEGFVLLEFSSMES